MNLFHERCVKLEVKVANLIEQARSLWGVELQNVAVRFDLRGRTAGQAGIRRGGMFLRFNQQMMLNDCWDSLINDTAPHEVAHLVCYAAPALGRRHDAGWARVCRMLGGTGNRCHEELVEFAKGPTYYYTTSTGYTAAVSPAIHCKIQGGQARYFRDPSKGTVNSACAWTTVRPSVEARAQAQAAMSDRPVEFVQVAKPVEQPVIVLSNKFAGQSKADQVRAEIRRVQAASGTVEAVVAWAVSELGMTRALARTYVRNNWSR